MPRLAAAPSAATIVCACPVAGRHAESRRAILPSGLEVGPKGQSVPSETTSTQSLATVDAITCRPSAARRRVFCRAKTEKDAEESPRRTGRLAMRPATGLERI